MPREDDGLNKDRVNESVFSNEPENENICVDEPEQEDESPEKLSGTEAADRFPVLIRYRRNANDSPGSRRSV